MSDWLRRTIPFGRFLVGLGRSKGYGLLHDSDAVLKVSFLDDSDTVLEVPVFLGRRRRRHRPVPIDLRRPFTLQPAVALGNRSDR
jgi:hypothetical protein